MTYQPVLARVRAAVRSETDTADLPEFCKIEYDSGTMLLVMWLWWSCLTALPLWEIQIVYMRFAILKVRNPLLCTVLRRPLYVIAGSPVLWD